MVKKKSQKLTFYCDYCFVVFFIIIYLFAPSTVIPRVPCRGRLEQLKMTNVQKYLIIKSKNLGLKEPGDINTGICVCVCLRLGLKLGLKLGSN